jgi:hypothetical protein
MYRWRDVWRGGGGFFMRNRLGKCMLGGVPCTDGEMYGGGGDYS